MLYKTIVMELLKQIPDHCTRQNSSLSEIERLSIELRTSHRQIMSLLSVDQPDTAMSQISSQAMEIAVADLQARLGIPTSSNETQDHGDLSLNLIMENLHHHSSSE